MRTYKIYLIRHGITQGNLEGKYVGPTDMPLCEQGIEEIKQLTQKYEYPRVAKVYSSPMIRCIETANIIYDEMIPELVDDLREYDFGPFENQPIEELMKNETFQKWIKSSWSQGLSGAENMQAFMSRIVSGLDSVVLDMMKNKMSDAAVITHGGVIMQLLTACGLPQRKPLEWGVGNGKGYTLLVNASLWANNKIGEVYTALPYGDELTNKAVGYSNYEEENEDEKLD